MQEKKLKICNFWYLTFYGRFGQETSGQPDLQIKKSENLFLLLCSWCRQYKLSFEFMIFDGFKQILVEEPKDLSLNFSGFGRKFDILTTLYLGLIQH